MTLKVTDYQDGRLS